MLALDHARRVVEIETVRLEHAALHFGAVDEVLDAGSGLIGARAQEAAEDRKDRKGAIAAMLERARQAALDPAGGDPGHEEGKASIGAPRQAADHIILRIPARSAGTFDQHAPRLAVERDEMAAVILRNLDVVDGADVEAPLVVHHD